ncbi:Protein STRICTOSIDINE SYNTHASE-LIKE 6, partial [Cucurbita argyrosperma subsp. argyrosperma]
MAITRRHGWRPNLERNGGAVAVNLEGKQVAWYYDYGLSMITTGLKIKNHLYCGSFVFPGILRLNLDRYPARTAGCPWSNSGDL